MVVSTEILRQLKMSSSECFSLIKPYCTASKLNLKKISVLSSRNPYMERSLPAERMERCKFHSFCRQNDFRDPEVPDYIYKRYI